MEKAKGIQPSDMMDREKAHIPAVQIGFLDHVALPVYRLEFTFHFQLVSMFFYRIQSKNTVL